METTTEPIVINGETYVPGTGRFAQYYKRDNAGPWLELRDGWMVKADFSRGPRWWRRLPKFWKVMLVIAAFSWGSWLLVFGASFIAGFVADDAPEPAPAPSTSVQLTEEQLIEQAADYIADTYTLEQKANACANLAASTSIYEYAEAIKGDSQHSQADEQALLVARSIALFCSR